MADQNKIKKARKIAEQKILEHIRDWDDSGFNEKEYMEYFSKMSDIQFQAYMNDILNDKVNLHVEVDNNKPVSIVQIEDVAKKYGIKLREFVAMPFGNPNNPDNPTITRSPIPIAIVTVRKLQQMIDKKNNIVGDNSSINPITGQVQGVDKAAKWSNVQTCMVTVSKQDAINKEFLGPRADDEVSKKQMIQQIERYGKVSMKDLDIKTKNKQAVRTVDVFMAGAGIQTNLSDEIEHKKEQ